jgi:hypothetical protein
MNDYIGKLQEKYPQVPEKTLKRIIKRGFYIMNDLMINGKDIRLKGASFLFMIYIPRLYKLKKKEDGQVNTK